MSDLLINIDDIREYRDVALNINQNKIDTAILDAQRQDLRSVLGDPLYLDFTKKVFLKTDADFDKYQELLNGKEYTLNNFTLEFYGVKPMLVRYAYARLAKTGNKKVTRYGQVKKITDQSNPVSSEENFEDVTDARSSALVYQEDLIKFLTNNTTIYPLWDVDETTAPSNSSGFEFTSARNVDNRFDASYNRNVTP